MTVSTSANRADYLGNNVTTAFAVPFYFPDPTNLKVLSTVLATGVSTTLVLNSDYTVAGAGVSGGGTVTTSVPVAAGIKLSVLLNVAYVQQTHYVPNDPFPAASHEAALDYLTLLAKQTAEQVGRAVQVPPGENGTVVQLPPAPARAGFLLGFDGSGAFTLVAAAAQSATALALSLLSNAGSTLVSHLAAWPGAVLRTLFSRLSDTATVNDAGVAADGSTDDAAKLNAVLTSGKKVIEGLGLTCKINSSITIPAGVELRNINLVHGTAGMNGVLLNTGSRAVRVKVTGTGTTNMPERGFYPAADGVTDVYLDVEVTNLTYGVHAQNLGTYTSANYPRRWSGRIWAHDLVGAVGVSEGYGLLLSPAWDCKFDVLAKNIPRHALYLSAGTNNCTVDLDVDTVYNYACQLASNQGAQDATAYNTVRIKARNLQQNVAGNSAAVCLFNLVKYNTITLDVQGNGVAYYAATVQGSSVNGYPFGNKIVDGNITGQFLGSDVINIQNGDSTTVARNRIDAYATFSAIASRTSGTNGSTHSGFFYDNQINCLGNNCAGIYDEVTSAPAYIGLNEIRNTGTSARVIDSTSGKRTGFSRRLTFSGTTASVAGSSTLDVAALLPDNIAVSGRRTDVWLTGASLDYTSRSLITGLLPADETHSAFRVDNASASAQTFNYEGKVEGD